jgi:hypothetical protein
MAHVAECHCGEVQIVCRSEPDPVVICHCELCQRRTGSFFHVAAWFALDTVQISGTTRAYTRTTGDAGLPFTFNFCINCGTSIWWRTVHPEGPLGDKIGIAGGCFAEKDFPAPTVSIYEKHKHSWLSLPPGIRSYEAGM